MRSIILFMSALLLAILLSSTQALALTMSEFKAICDSSPTECQDHPFLQAYVGGALDVVAVLSENTDYLDEIYCEDPSVLFDVKRIIPFMQQHQKEYASENAMLVLIRYLEENDGCR